jgi:hypothetical protein
LKCAVPAAAYQSSNTLPTYAAEDQLVWRFGFRFSGNPSVSAVPIFEAPCGISSAFVILDLLSTGHLRVRFSGGTSPTNGSSIAVSPNTYIRVEIVYDGSSGTAHKARLRVDGVENATDATVTTAGVGASTTSRIGVINSVTLSTARDLYWDDFIVGSTSTGLTGGTPFTDYWGDGEGLAVIPGSDGTHSFTANDFSTGEAGTLRAQSYTDFYLMVDDAFPWVTARSTTDNIAQRVARSTAYVEIKPATTAPSGRTANAVRALMAYSATTATANTAACIIRNSGGVATSIWGDHTGIGGNAAALQDHSEITNFFKGAVVTPPGAGWTKTEIEALRWRVGAAGDISPVPTWQFLALEIDYPIASVVDATVVAPAGLVTANAGQAVLVVAIPITAALVTLSSIAPVPLLKIIAPAGLVTFNAVAPLIPHSVTIVAPSGLVTFNAPTHVPLVRISAPVGSITFSAPTLTASATVAPTVGTVTFNSGSNVPELKMVAPAGLVTFSGGTNAVVVTGATIVIAPVGTLTFNAPTQVVRITMVAPAGLVTFNAPLNSIQIRVIAPPGSINFSGGQHAQNVTITIGLFEAASVMFTAQSSVRITIVAPVGVVTFNGGTNAVFKGRIISAPSGTITFNAPSLSASVTVSPIIGTVTFSGAVHTVGAGTTKVAPPGTVTFSGAAPVISRSDVAVAQIGTVTFSAVAPVIIVRISAPVGVLTFSAAAPVLRITLTAPVGNLTFSAPTPTLIRSVFRQVPSGTVVFNGPTHIMGSGRTIVVPSGTTQFSAVAPLPRLSATANAGLVVFSGGKNTPGFTIIPGNNSLLRAGESSTLVGAGTEKPSLLGASNEIPNIVRS